MKLCGRSARKRPLPRRLGIAVLVSCGSAFVIPFAPAVAQAAPPNNTSPPTISGTAVEGETLTVTDDGTWTGDPDDFDYQWQRSDGGPYEDIDTATNDTYTLTSADIDHTIRVLVTASNADGPSDPEPSNEIGPVAAAPEPPQRSLELSVKRRPVAFKRAFIRAEGVASPALRLWVYEKLRGKECAATPAERTGRTRMLIDGETVGGNFSEERRPRMKRPGPHAFCAYLGPDEDTVTRTSFVTRKVRKPFLSASRARETIKDALRRHGFANRVLANLSQSCARRSRSAFECQFSSSFPGYSLSGHGSVERKRRVSYRFPVSIKGRSFTLTDENEGGLRG
jgi:hypothetical protein